MGSFSIFHWLIVLAIVVLIFGTKNLPKMFEDLGKSMSAFKKGLNDGNADDKAKLDKPEEPAKPEADKPGPDKPSADR